MSIFFNVVFPVFLILSTGFLLGTFYRGKDFTLVSKVAFWIFIPVLSFTFLNDNPVGLDTLGLTAFGYFCVFGIMLILSGSVFRFLRLSKAQVFFTLVFTNAGYFGYPVIMSAFGEEKLSYAVVFAFTITFLMGTLGIYMASSHPMAGLKNIFKVPYMYAFVLALVLNALNIHYSCLPAPLLDSLNMLKKASLPFLLIFVGLSLSRVKIEKTNVIRLSGVTALKLLLVPMVAILIAKILRFEPDMAKVFVVEFAMPTGINASVIASEFNMEPDFISTVVFVTTLLSALSLPPVIYLVNVIF